MNRLTNDMQDMGMSRAAADDVIRRVGPDSCEQLVKGVIANIRVLIHEGRTDEAIRTLNRLQYYVIGDT